MFRIEHRNLDSAPRSSQHPRQMFSLLRVVADLRAARTALSDGRRRLGGNLSFPGELQLNPSV